VFPYRHEEETTGRAFIHCVSDDACWMKDRTCRLSLNLFLDRTVLFIEHVFNHDLSATSVPGVVFRSGTSGFVVHCQTPPGTSAFNSSSLFLLWLLHLCLLGHITSCSRPWTHLYQGKFKRKGFAQNVSNSNVCLLFL
jgi:hypothetical protein